MSHTQEENLSHKRKLLFKTLTVLLPLAILLLAELGLRVFSYGGSMRLFVAHKIESSQDYMIVNPFVGLKYFDQFKATEATNDIFLKHKPENGFRVFVLGSSTTYGFPYERNLMASRILHKRLQDAYPDKVIEVVNTSITAINSVTLKDFARQIYQQEADAVLIYAGHNEFYGAFGPGSNETMVNSAVLRSLHFKLMNLRLYQLMQAGISGKGRSKDGEAAEKGTLMKRIVNDKEITYNGDKYKLGLMQFENNLNSIIDQAKKKGIPVFISDLVSNVKDVPPFGTSDPAGQSPEFNYKAAWEALSKGDSAKAKELFYTAKDLDPVRFRASEDINRIIHQIAKEKGCILLPAMERFSDASPFGIIGDELLAEHVHPNIEGQFLLADLFYNKIVGSGLIAVSPDPLTERSAAYYRRNWGYTALDSLMGEYKVKQLKSYWPYTSLENETRFRDAYQPKGVVEDLAFKVITDPDENGESLHDQLGDHYEKTGRPDLALKEYEALACINPYWSDYLDKTAKAFYDLNDLHGAQTCLLESLKYTPSYFSYSMLGEIEFIQHDYKTALQLFESAYQLLDKEGINEESRTFLLNRLDVLNHMNKDAGKEQEYPFEYSNYIPFDIVEDFEKAISLSASDIDSSLYYLDRCLQINDCPLVNLYIGDVLYQKQDLKALHYYQKAYAAYAMDPGYLVRLFYAYFVNVNKSKAEEVLKQLKRIDPSNGEIPRLETLVSVLQ